MLNFLNPWLVSHWPAHWPRPLQRLGTHGGAVPQCGCWGQWRQGSHRRRGHLEHHLSHSAPSRPGARGCSSTAVLPHTSEPLGEPSPPVVSQSPKREKRKRRRIVCRRRDAWERKRDVKIIHEVELFPDAQEDEISCGERSGALMEAAPWLWHKKVSARRKFRRFQWRVFPRLLFSFIN